MILSLKKNVIEMDVFNSMIIVHQKGDKVSAYISKYIFMIWFLILLYFKIIYFTMIIMA